MRHNLNTTTMKNYSTIIAQVLLWLAASVQTATSQDETRTFYIDFGQNNVSGQGFLTSTDNKGNTWNNLHGVGKGAPDKVYSMTSVPLAASDGSQTECVLQTRTTFSTNGYTNGGLQKPQASLLGDLAVETATQDYIFLEGAQDYGLLLFSGLDRTKAYRFYSFGSRKDSGTPGRVATFQFCGSNRWQGTHCMGAKGIGNAGYDGNNNNVQESDLIFPDENGNIEMTIVKHDKGGMVHLNAMKIVEVAGQTAPVNNLALNQTIYIDFGETSNSSRGHQTTTKDKNGHYWSNVSSGNSSSNVIPAKDFVLRNSTGKSSGFVLTTTCKQYTNGVNAGGNNSPADEDLGDLAVATATEDYMFIDNGDVRPFVFSKLDKANCYRLSFYGSRNHTDSRVTQYVVEGQGTWTGGQVTSGFSVGGKDMNGNLRNVLVSDYIYPDRSGQITVRFSRIKGMAHVNAIKIEEFTGGQRPEDPVQFASLQLTGNAEDVSFKPVGGDVYRAYARLDKGTFRLSGISADGQQLSLTSLGDGRFAVVSPEDPEAFVVDEACVARITVDAAARQVTLLPVTMHVCGSVATARPELEYKGGGVWESEVTLNETSSQQWVDRTMYFSLGDNDNLAIRRLKGASSRYALGMASDGQDVENIYQNPGTYTITVDMAREAYDIQAPVDEYRVSVFGSSVANGQGATDFKGYRYLYGEHLKRRYSEGLSEYPFYTSNVSIGGNTTENLLARYDDLIRDFGRYVIFGLSLGNEGIHGASDQEAVFAKWRDNMLRLINKVRADGKVPVVMNNYTRGDYDASDYSYVKRLNLLIHEWGVPSFNCLGSIDDGKGHWADGYVADTYHQNTEGHYEFFTCMVPSLFDALKEGKAYPKRNTTKSLAMQERDSLTFSPEGVCHPFTVTLRIKGGAGTVCKVLCSEGEAVVSVGEDGKVTLTTPSGSKLTSSNALTATGRHYVTLTSYYAQRRTLLYLDRVCAGEVSERLGKVSQVVVGGSPREMSELFFWRSAMTPEEVAAVCNGKMLKSSLEIYSPLSDEDGVPNLAQSTNTLTLKRNDTANAVVGVSGSGALTCASVVYSLCGQRIPSVQPGVNVVSGRKVLVR